MQYTTLILISIYVFATGWQANSVFNSKRLAAGKLKPRIMATLSWAAVWPIVLAASLMIEGLDRAITLIKKN